MVEVYLTSGKEYETVIAFVQKQDNKAWKAWTDETNYRFGALTKKRTWSLENIFPSAIGSQRRWWANIIKPITPQARPISSIPRATAQYAL